MNQVQLINNIIVDDKYGIKELPPSQDLFLRGDYINPNLTKQIVNNSFDGKRPCSAAIIGCNNTSLSNEKLKYPFWTAHDAEENYLLSKPTCFLILGKEGRGATELGERLAHHWKCVHLNPENIILNEMEQNSVTGKCMNFNMRHNKPLTSEILMSILSEKLNSPIVQHRGYVLTGFPLVNTTEKVAELQPVCYSELALIIAYDIISDIISVCILVKPNKKSRKSDFNEEENLEEEASIAEEIVDEMIENEGNVDFDKDAITIEDLKMMSSLEICEDIIKKRSKTALVGLKSSISKQLFHIFDLPLVPDIIIYVTCPDEDIVTKQEHSVVSYPHMNSITLPFTSSGKSISDIRWPTKYMNEEKLKIRKPISTDNHKYHTKLPSHFRKPVLFQMCNYNKFVLPFIENEFTKYDPNSILKVDGRYTIDAMFETVLSQLTNLSVTPTLIPTTLLKYMQETLLDYAENEGENPIPEDYVEFWNFIGNLTPFHLPSSIQFNLSSSLWHNKCPVQLSLGRSLNGKTKFAAIMFNKVYLLSTKEHLIEFCKNPRPYLKLEHLKLTCRILILGTKSSGKSSVAVLLKWLLDAEIINFNDIVNEEKSRKYKAYVASILNLIIPVVEQQRRSEWEAKETARKRELNIFLDKRVLEAEKYVQQYEKALKEKIKMQEERKQKGKERKQAMGAEGDENLPGEDEYDFEEEIDYELSRKILENKDNALNEAPQYLTDALPIPTSPQDGDEDVNQLVSKYITDKEPFDELTPVPEDVVKVLTTLVKTIEENTIRETNGRNQYGRWIVDGFSPSPEYWQILIESGIIPDEVICLVDDREIDEEFYKTSYKLFTNPVSTQQYAKIKDPLIQLKLSHSLNIPETLDAHSIAKQSEEKAFKVVEDDMNKMENEITELNESLKEFREQWASSKAMLEELGKMPIEIITGEIDILQIMSEVVRFLRIHMNKPCEPYETGEQSEDAGSEQTDNEIKYIKEDNRFLGDMGLYCPVAYQTHGVLWKGKSEFATKFDNKIYFFSSEENLEKFKGDPTIFLNASNPFKKLPPPRICVVGGQGTGRSSVSKFIAEELGIFHIDFSIIVNSIILPPHFKKVGIQFENIFTDNLHQADEENDEAERVEYDEADDVRFLLNNEKLFRQRVQDYFEQGTPLPNEILRNAIKHLWFTEPYLSGGFVLDGFPLLLADVESMISMCAIPDCVIELSAECETIVSRLVPVMLDKWKKQQDAAMKESQKKFKLLHDKWRQTIERPVFIQLPIKDIEARNKSKGEKPMERLYSVDANIRRVPVPDDRFDYLCEYHKPLSKVPAFLNVVDIAGLVKGAAEGQGLGNAFLSHIKACDSIFNLCRAFDDEDVIHVDGEVNPVRDLETIGEELRLKDEEQLLQNLDKLERVVARGGDKKLKPEYDALLKIKGVLVDEKKHIRFGDWSANEIEILNRYLFLTSKPALYLVNLSEKDYIRKKNKWLPKLKEWVDKNDPGALLIPFSGALETKLLEMEPAERAAYLKEINVTSALDKIIINGYKALQLEYFFTAGPDEVKAWTVQKGTKAPQAAGRIHTDFEKGFIMAEVMHYKDFKEEGSEVAAKAAGKYRQQGRNYTVEDGDIIFFKFNAGAGLKDAKKK